MQKIIPSLWFEGNANDAVQFYQDVFSDVSVDVQTSIQTPFGTTSNVVSFKIFDYQFVGLDSEKKDENNPAVSFIVKFDDEASLVETYRKLSAVDLIPLDKYDFTGGDYYGWCMDSFGISWQVWLEPNATSRIIPQLMCINDNNGKAHEMIEFYSKIFDGKVQEIHEYPEGAAPDVDAKVMLGSVLLETQEFILQDSGGNNMHKFDFNYGVALIVNVHDQEEYDKYYEALLGDAEACGWVKDPYGLSFQVLPDDYFELIRDKGQQVADAIFQMKKIDVEKLRASGR